MWIRSQNKENLIEVNNVNVEGNNVVTLTSGNRKLVLGSYISEDRAFDLVDDIQQRLVLGSKSDRIDKFGNRVFSEDVYIMPKN